MHEIPYSVFRTPDREPEHGELAIKRTHSMYTDHLSSLYAISSVDRALWRACLNVLAARRIVSMQNKFNQSKKKESCDEALDRAVAEAHIFPDTSKGHHELMHCLYSYPSD